MQFCQLCQSLFDITPNNFSSRLESNKKTTFVPQKNFPQNVRMHTCRTVSTNQPRKVRKVLKSHMFVQKTFVLPHNIFDNPAKTFGSKAKKDFAKSPAKIIKTILSQKLKLLILF